MKQTSGFTGGGGDHVQQLIAGTGITLSPSSGTGVVTINSADGANVMLVDGGLCSTYRCGVNNSAIGSYAFSGGGQCNLANGNYSFVGGGFGNCATACAAVLGGFGNNASAPYSGAFGCNINACNACTFYSNNLCACGNTSSITANVTCLTSGQAVCSGANGILTNFTPAIVNNAFGSFYDTTTQTTAGNENLPMKLNNTDSTATSGFSIQNDTLGNPTKIVAATSGIYNMQFSAQLYKTGGTAAQIYIWLSKQGSFLPDSNTVVQMANNTDYLVAAWNYFLPLSAGQYTQLYWRSTLNSVSILNNTTPVGIGLPAIPSVILTMAKLSEIV